MSEPQDEEPPLWATGTGQDEDLLRGLVNYEAEMALLGALLANNQVMDSLGDGLQPWHFADPTNGRVFRMIRKLLSEKGGVADPVTLARFAENDGQISQIGGRARIGELASSFVSIINATDYAKLIVEMWQRRELVKAADTLRKAALDREHEGVPNEVMGVLASHDAALTEIMEGSAAAQNGGAKHIREFAAAATHNLEMALAGQRGIGIPTGLSDYDRLHGPLMPTDLIVVAGRPSMGKSHFLWHLAKEAAYHEPNKAFLLVSLEMSGEQFAVRDLSFRSDYEVSKVRRADLTPQQFAEVEKILREEVSAPNIFIDDSPGATVQSIRATARRLMRQEGLSGIGIDYLQLMGDDAPAERGRRHEANRVQELSRITRGLKLLAKELNVPIVLLSQLSRQVEMRDDKRPMLSDLRDSGSIEQDADSVTFIYRDSYYLARSEPKRRAEESDTKFSDRVSKWEAASIAARNKCDLIVGKGRHGADGFVQVFFQLNRGFADLAR